MPGRTRKRKKKGRPTWDWYLLGLVGLAVVVLGSFLWFLIRERTQQPIQVVDFGDRLREIAAERGSIGSDLVADDPIRKIDGVFVRTWRIGVPNRSALEALEGDIVVEAGQWQGTLTEVAQPTGDTRRMRLDFEGEAFDLELSVIQRRQYVLRAPTATPRVLPTATARPSPRLGARGKLAILLDDAGQSRELLRSATGLPPQIGVAILPFLPNSADVANAMHRTGHEVWLHLPMEPEGYPKSNPGPGAVLVSMSESEIRAAVHTALNNVPHVVGVNNHMGSKATADLRTMTWVMQELKARGMMFIDSRTTRNTVAEDAAFAQGVAASRRHVFLDNERTRSAVRGQLAEAVERCRMEGEIIALGHLAKVTIEVLQKEMPTFKRRGVDLVAPSTLVK
jgi:polysaccharide deacetylase 2 family uncharacterized protein YibQ